MPLEIYVPVLYPNLRTEVDKTFTATYPARQLRDGILIQH